MKYRVLGCTGVQVSQLCFGTMSFGGDADPQESARMYRACRDAGINFFDTADQYNKGRSEEILGELIRGERDGLSLAPPRQPRRRGEPEAAGHRSRGAPLSAPLRRAHAARRADARARGPGAR